MSLDLISRPDRFFIGGDWVAPSTGSRIDVINPSTEEVFVSVAEAQAVDMERAIAAAREAFDRGPWRKMSHAERGGYVRALGKAIEQRAEDFARIWTSQIGVTLEIARGSIALPVYAFEQNAQIAETFPFEERHEPKWSEGVGLLVREPVGVVGAIIPWNAPLVMIGYKLAPALVAGCTVVVKSSPEAPGEALLVAEIAAGLGFPPGVINVVTADREVSEMLVRDPRVDKISFTGSSLAGKRIASLCGERIARFTLELGGKSAGILLDDYDVENVAETLGIQATALSGQVCCSITRLICTRKRHDDLVGALAARFKQIRVGDPFASNTDMGPLAMRRQRERVEELIAAGKAEGATLATGGARPAALNRGFYIEPTVFGNVANSSTIAQQEIFGPVISVIPADSEDQAIDIANDTVYGLNNTVYTNDPDRAYRFARELRSGTVGQNSDRSDATIAFGGFKQSGIGREGGVEGLHEFLETKTIVLDSAPSHLRSA